MNKNLLKQYARLVAGVGINVQKGQTVVVRCPVDCADFGRALCAACFELGAKDVVMDWRDDVCSREHYPSSKNCSCTGVHHCFYPIQPALYR